MLLWNQMPKNLGGQQGNTGKWKTICTGRWISYFGMIKTAVWQKQEQSKKRIWYELSLDFENEAEKLLSMLDYGNDKNCIRNKRAIVQSITHIFISLTWEEEKNTCFFGGNHVT